MFVLLFLLWLVLNGAGASRSRGPGAGGQHFVAWGCQRALACPSGADGSSGRGFYARWGYLPLLLREVWTANLQVILRILCPRRRRGPAWSWMDPGLREPGTQFLLANSITLTPGTVTVALHGDACASMLWIKNSPRESRTLNLSGVCAGGRENRMAECTPEAAGLPGRGALSADGGHAGLSGAGHSGPPV